MSSAITRISLPDGTPVLARISEAEQLAPPGARRSPEQEEGRPGQGGARGSRGEKAEETGEAGDDGYTDTGFRARPRPAGTTRMESLRGLITGVAASVAEGLRAARPDEVSVSFGIELTARAGKVVGLLADGEAKAAISVTLTWQGGPPEELGRPDGAGEHGGRTGGGHGPL
ncbi:CU044_2847 family protein [Streptomyces hoynatensis]|uniref:CU044_2847 family protein n=1 Tax=Streptomyces hoynatensis TaxID=1141874 RepID=UPI001F4DC994|nr:CU044_2847 family protein [Streptomyces hoynatensis]